jgi:hypothetical protein
MERRARLRRLTAPSLHSTAAVNQDENLVAVTLAFNCELPPPPRVSAWVLDAAPLKRAMAGRSGIAASMDGIEDRLRRITRPSPADFSCAAKGLNMLVGVLT